MNVIHADYCPICHDYVYVHYIENRWACGQCGADLGEEDPIIEKTIIEYY